MMHMGEAPHPSTGDVGVNLALAKNTIDLLRLMENKTNGNLDEEEKTLLETLVVELQNRYESVAKGDS